jgi:hypothetical protein
MHACILDQGRKGDGAASPMISPEIVLRHGKDLALVLEACPANAKVLRPDR